MKPASTIIVSLIIGLLICNLFRINYAQRELKARVADLEYTIQLASKCERIRSKLMTEFSADIGDLRDRVIKLEMVSHQDKQLWWISTNNFIDPPLPWCDLVLTGRLDLNH